MAFYIEGESSWFPWLTQATLISEKVHSYLITDEKKLLIYKGIHIKIIYYYHCYTDKIFVHSTVH